ncbi:MAG: hypothetical protein ACBZ72_09295 [Candidatus Bathyarchaeia archaeon]|jgi:hypothetical protein
MGTQEVTAEKLWQILVETVQANVMYPTHKAYTRDVILKEQPDISADDLALKLNMPLGEAMVILQELQGKNPI